MLARQITERRQVELIAHPAPVPGISGEIVSQPELACVRVGHSLFAAEHPEYPQKVVYRADPDDVMIVDIFAKDTPSRPSQESEMQGTTERIQ